MQLTQTFDQKFKNEIEAMQDYLIRTHLRAIGFTFTNGWRFKMNIPQKDYQKLLNNIVGEMQLIESVEYWENQRCESLFEGKIRCLEEQGHEGTHKFIVNWLDSDISEEKQLNPFNKLCWYLVGKPFECDKCQRGVYKNWKFCPGCGVDLEW